MLLTKYLEYNQGNKTVENWINTVLKNYLKKETNIENQGEIEHIIDYLKSKKAPKRIDRMSYDEAKSNSEKWMKTLIKKAQNIVETEEDIEIIHTFKTGNLSLVKLVGENAFKREGKLMSHCVSSYFGRNDVDVYSLRDGVGNPHCTIEVTRKGKSVNQIKGKGNGSIHPKYIKYVLKSLKKIGREIRESEFQYLGYVNLNDVAMGFNNLIESNYKDVQFMLYKGKKFVYIHSLKMMKDKDETK